MTLADDVAALGTRAGERAGADWAEVTEIVTQLEHDKAELLAQVARLTDEKLRLSIMLAGERER